jgi:hypothetical protein
VHMVVTYAVFVSDSYRPDTVSSPVVVVLI